MTRLTHVLLNALNESTSLLTSFFVNLNSRAIKKMENEANEFKEEDDFYMVKQLILPSPRVYIIKTWSFLEILQR